MLEYIVLNANVMIHVGVFYTQPSNRSVNNVYLQQLALESGLRNLG